MPPKKGSPRTRAQSGRCAACNTATSLKNNREKLPLWPPSVDIKVLQRLHHRNVVLLQLQCLCSWFDVQVPETGHKGSKRHKRGQRDKKLATDPAAGSRRSRRERRRSLLLRDPKCGSDSVASSGAATPRSPPCLRHSSGGAGYSRPNRRRRSETDSLPNSSLDPPALPPEAFARHRAMSD